MDTANRTASHHGVSNRLDLGGWLRLMLKHKWLVLFCGIACGTLAFLWTARQTKIYLADCTIRHIPDPPKPLGRKMETYSPLNYWSTREHFATENLILGSRAIAERVVSELGLHQDPTFVGERKPGPDGKPRSPATITEAASILQQMLTIQPERETRVVHIRIEDRDPERAALLADSIADAYIAKTVEDRLGSTTAALEWLGQQLEGLKKQLESSELALHDFKDKHNVLSISLEDRQNIVSNDIQRYTEALSTARTRRIEVAARLEALGSANAEDPFLVHASATDEAPSVEHLRQQYRTAEAEQAQLAIEYGHNHPRMLAVTEWMDLLREQLRSEIDGIIDRAQNELEEVVAVEAGIRQALQESNQAGLRLNLQEIEYRRLIRERDNTDRLYSAVLERTAETDLTRALRVQYAQVVDRALVPTAAIRPRVPMAVTLGVILGLALGLLLVLLLSQLDRVVRTVEQAEALGLTVLGIVPQIDKASGRSQRRRRGRKREHPIDRDLHVHTNPKSAVAECCRTIRTNFTFAATKNPVGAFVVTSASPREGKTTVSISLGISLAQSGKKVLLADTDLRKPRIHRAFGLRSGLGVTSVLVGDKDVMEAVQETKVPGLRFLASGPIPPNPSELLHTTQFTNMLERLREEFDIVILDSPPLVAVTDAAIIAPQVDGALLVVHTLKTARDAVKSALRQLKDVQAHLIGGILNDVDLNRQKYGYGSYYYYRSEGYYDVSSEAPEEERPAAEG